MPHSLFDEIISLDNLFAAWKEFRKSKRSKPDVQEFELNLEDNIFRLHDNLKNCRYKHGEYVSFNISDPKPRLIHKALVVDRVLHHAVFRVLYPVFDRDFIDDSYSCRLNKGTHKAVEKLSIFIQQASRNHKNSCFVLKCDIKKFFHSIDHDILLHLIAAKTKDKELEPLIGEIVCSFNQDTGKGVPLGNLTSQLFANVYLNELDVFIKRTLGVKGYARYTDDFVLVHSSPGYLKELILKIEIFLSNKLQLQLHPEKVVIRKVGQGVDFLGYVVFPYYILLRDRTKKRLLRKIDEKLCKNENRNQKVEQTLASYYGILKHCRSYRIKETVNCMLSHWL